MKKSNLYLAVFSLLIDVVALFSGLVIAYHIRAQGLDLFAWPFERYLSYVIWIVPLWVLLFASQGLYNARNLPKGWSAFTKIITGLVGGWGVILIALYMWRSPESLVFPRLIIVYGVALTTALTLFSRALVRAVTMLLRRRSIGLVRAVVIGVSPNTAIAQAIAAEPVHGRVLVATINPSDALDQLEKLYRTQKFDEVIISETNTGEETLLPIIEWAESVNCSVVLVPSIMAVRATNVEYGSLAGSAVLFLRRTPLDGWGRVYKRVLDLFLVIPALMVLSPIFLLLALVVKLSSPGPVIYRERRVGQDGRELFVAKFRSMYSDWRERFPDVQDWSGNEANDVRVTAIGRFLRRTNLDELPQLWEVLAGRMSLVGPRPEQPKYVEKFAQEIPAYLKRHRVKTGLTGWAQVNGLRGNTSIPERVKYDLYYIENWSIWFDIRIIISTIAMLLRQPIRPSQ
ncbi:MAG: exopolysaccharide biosynthesis polyprenyl glycosylphosphotransferase [Patescibacteria group bacterium]